MNIVALPYYFVCDATDTLFHIPALGCVPLFGASSPEFAGRAGRSAHSGAELSAR